MPRRGGQVHGDQHLVMGQDIFLGRIHLRQREEIGGGDDALARRTGNAELRVERHQRGRGVGGMNDDSSARRRRSRETRFSPVTLKQVFPPFL